MFKPLPIAVCGATGKQGGAVAYELLARGHKVRAFTRNPNKEAAQSLASAGAELVKVDLENTPDIIHALEGVSALYSVQDFLEAGVEAEKRQGLNALLAAQKANVKRIVYSGASTMDRNTGVAHLDSKWEVEKALRESDLNYTIFRPAAFLENWEWERESVVSGDNIFMPLRPNMMYKQISVKDIAKMVVTAIEQPKKWSMQIAPLAGDVSTPLEIAEAFSAALKKPIRYQQISWEECEAQQGEELTSMYRYFDEFGMNGAPEMLQHWGVTPTTLSQYLSDADWS